ncbi:60S ribosomal protein L18a-like protein isoform X3 [Solanum stenotomum]|uniref:60S ribosomal protein L18a-like protein isoform X3 n=1 Tax=Solanum stenotomum TaxID=172797 RepID=UPI0020D15FA5|nr:60S ribosomal protein L18a-like protein isoform X3 [Solanum stenotomum]
MSEEGKDSHYHHHDHHYGHHHHHYGHHHHHHEETQPPPPWLPTAPPVVAEYGTFQPPPQPVIDFPLPVPPPGAVLEPFEYYARGYQSVPVPPPGAVLEPSEYYARGYQSAPGYLVDERRPVTEPRLPFGIGLGWFLFIIGFFLAGFPWYVAPFIPLCNRSIDHREKSGYIACTIAAVLAVIGNIVFGLTWILLTA